VLRKIYIYIILFACVVVFTTNGIGQPYQFYNTLSRPQLDSYLNRSVITEFNNLNSGSKEYQDIILYAASVNARILYSCFAVGYAPALPINYGFFDSVRNVITDIRRTYLAIGQVPPMVNVAIWESVTSDIDSIWMDTVTANAYKVPVRRFIFDSIKYAGDTSTIRATPDITRLETQMYFFYLATNFIRQGVENIHFGQIALENRNDSGNHNSWDLYSRIRRYARHFNRGLVIINGDTYGLYAGNSDTLLYDYNTAPSRVSGFYTGTDSTWTSMWDFDESQYGGPGQLSYNDCSPYGKMLGGRSVQGWYADTRPYQVALDNTLTNLCNCLNQGGCWNAWGFDEISWFCLQTPEYRNQWLCYANSMVKKLDRNCSFVMPVRTLFTRYWKYYDALDGYGYNQQDAITTILNGQMKGCDPNRFTDLRSVYSAIPDACMALIAYPNPAIGSVKLLFHAPGHNQVLLSICDIVGNRLATFRTEESEGIITWETAGIPDGVYFCTASNATGNTATTKVTVVH